MQIKQGDVAILTGASQGLGVFIAHALAEAGVNLVLAARSAAGLEDVAQQLKKSSNIQVLTVPTDVSRPDALNHLVDRALQAFGHIDILVNNAGVEYALRFDELGIEEIQDMIAVNLNGPMVLTRLVLPHMLQRERGHIVNIASVAGIMASPYEETYVATKHGLVGFTRALRLTAQELKWPVSASVICPAFMDGTGMYESMKQKHGISAPAFVGAIHADALGAAVVRAIREDAPDIVLMKGTPRLNVAMLALLPRLFEFVTARLDVSAFFRKVAREHLEERRLAAGRKNG